MMNKYKITYWDDSDDVHKTMSLEIDDPDKQVLQKLIRAMYEDHIEVVEQIETKVEMEAE